MKQPGTLDSVYEEYFYKDWIINIISHYNGLLGFAVQSRYQHIVSVFDFWNDEDLEGIDETAIPFFYLEPDDPIAKIAGTNTNDPLSVLEFITNQINSILGISPKTSIVKLVNKKNKKEYNSTQRGSKHVAWASIVKDRDKKCTKCGSVYDLHAHHILPYKDNEALRLDPNNGTTLCSQCHREHHKEYGRETTPDKG